MTATVTPSPAPTATATLTPTFTPTPTVTPTLIPTHAPTLSGGAEDQLLVSLAKEKWEQLGLKNTGEFKLFQVNRGGENPQPYLPDLGGYMALEATSPDGRYLVISAFKNENYSTGDWLGSLYLVNRQGGDPVQISKHYQSEMPYDRTVLWLAQTGQVAYIAADEGVGVYLFNPASQERLKLTGKEDKPLWLYGADSGSIYWEQGWREGRYSTHIEAVYRSPLEKGQTERAPLDALLDQERAGGLLTVSPTGEWSAYRVLYCPEGLEAPEGGLCPYLFVARTDGTGERRVIKMETEPYQFYWSNDGSRLLFNTCETNDTCGMQGKYYLYTVANNQVVELSEITQKNFNWVRWSPDNKQIIFMGNPAFVLDTVTRQVRPILAGLQLDHTQTQADWYYADWLPAP